MKRIFFILLPLALGACASMDKEECVNADWRTFGLEDGANGRKVSSIARYRQACADYGVRPNLEEYQAGHAEGARSFCTASNGYATGRRGANGYENFCPADLAGPFVDAYERGLIVYAAEQRVVRARNNLDSIIAEIDTLDETIIDYTARVASSETPSDERVLLARDLVEMGTRRSVLTSERPQAERALSAAEREFSQVLREHGP